MKIIDMPSGKRLECKCGCVFEYYPSDIKRHSICNHDETWHTTKYVGCPYCGTETTIIEDEINSWNRLHNALSHLL